MSWFLGWAQVRLQTSWRNFELKTIAIISYTFLFSDVALCLSNFPLVKCLWQNSYTKIYFILLILLLSIKVLHSLVYNAYTKFVYRQWICCFRVHTCVWNYTLRLLVVASHMQKKDTLMNTAFYVWVFFKIWWVCWDIFKCLWFAKVKSWDMRYWDLH